MADRRFRAIECYNQAQAAVKSDPRAAYRLLSSAVMIDPTFAQGWFMLGCSNADLSLWHGAVAAFRRAVQLPDGEAAGDMNPETRQKAYANLAHRLYHLGELTDAWDANAQALLLNSNEAFALLNASMLESIDGSHAAAIMYADKAMQIDQSAIIGTGAAFAYLFAGEYARGLELFDHRIGYKLREFESYPYPRWDGRAVRTLLVVSDQGLGDAVSFARFLPLAFPLAEEIILRVPGELVRLLSGCWPKQHNLQIEPLSVTLPLADAWVSLMSLPVALRLSNDQIVNQPGLDIPVMPFPQAGGWKAAGLFSIGIAWQGAANNDIDRFRSVPFSDFLQLYKVPNVQLYCLQVGEAVKDLHDAGCAGSVRDLSPYIRDAADTASLMREMDLIICVDSFVGHLAGALGLECWTLLATMGGDYRAGRRGAHPIWYPRTTIFRQDDYETMQWPPVWSAVVRALGERVHHGKEISDSGDLGDRDGRSGAVG